MSAVLGTVLLRTITRYCSAHGGDALKDQGEKQN
jgi:hypothetical protein